MNFNVDTRSAAILGLALVGSVALLYGFMYSSPKENGCKIKDARTNKNPKIQNNSVVVENESISESLKGYKKTSDGRTTSYFNRELSDADAKLLGDCKPKKINVGESPNSNSPRLISTSPPPNNTSAWNVAGTWEEKKFTNWAHEELRNIIEKYTKTIQFEKNIYKFSFNKVSTIEGEVYITHTRGKKLYLYDLLIKCNWELQPIHSDSTVVLQGELIVNELTPDGDIEVRT